MIGLHANAGYVIFIVPAPIKTYVAKSRNIHILIIVTLAARNAIDGILKMNAQTFLNSLVTNAPKHLMCVMLVPKSELVFWNIIFTMQRKLNAYMNTHFQNRVRESI
jgi:hypothetical protein